ncbi:hypothetical protein FPZ12_026490 [Amycolatopsis acidicola]|uniref:Uncharacterized protein n=1 Tax=Amycolatopsis acidicola TaxID=2596893 RepID=A0A5N0UWA3_9PSEU|nr:hypothetical protein [Amycolatopsis acidicola]KAA9156966.1 hypothetical protein FPZ12_026490 [Amycolatopsis acidicola]
MYDDEDDGDEADFVSGDTSNVQSGWAGGWVRLILSTFLVVPVFLATEYRLHGDEFLGLRALGAVVVIALAASEGPGINALAGVVDLLARWLVWRF